MASMSDQKASEPATLQVDGEDAKLEIPPDKEIDLGTRDPNSMNDHVKVRFHDLIGEPDTEVYSFDKVWIFSYKVFTSTKIWCYRITSLLLAVPFAFLWGCYFACISFCNVWVCIPCIKSIHIELFCVNKIWTTCLEAFVRPCWEAFGMLFYNIRIKLQRSD